MKSQEGHQTSKSIHATFFKIMGQQYFTCFHPQSLCDVALLWWSLCGGSKRRQKNRCGPICTTFALCSGERQCERSPAGLSPDACSGCRSPGHNRGLWCGFRLCGCSGDSWWSRGSAGVFSLGGWSYSCGGNLDRDCCGVVPRGQRWCLRCPLGGPSRKAHSDWLSGG